jgi:broad specificity phosphatase PhoE
VPTVLLVRHAQASFGAADYDVLSELGHEQTQALVAGLERRGIRPDRVLSGALRRQRDTAQPCADAAGVELEIDERWAEYEDADILTHHAESDLTLEHVEGVSSREFQEILNVGLRGWAKAGDDSPCGQTWPAFRDRLRGALTDLAGSLGKGETALVSSSGGAIATIVAELLGLPPEAFVAFNHVSVNAAITKLTVGRGGLSVISINDHAHLEEAGTRLITYR